MDHEAYLGLGANLGDRLDALRTAVTRLDQMLETAVLASSNLYETAPVGGPPGQPEYLNGVVRIETGRSPRDLLAGCLAIERDLGRRRLVPDGPRSIDVDILLYDGLVLDDADLIIPHPRMHTRRFVLQPLADLAPGVLHPGLGVTVRELLTRLSTSDCRRGGVRRVADAGWASPG